MSDIYTWNQEIKKIPLKNYFTDYDEIDILRASQGRDTTDVTFGRLYYAFVMLPQKRKTIKQLTC